MNTAQIYNYDDLPKYETKIIRPFFVARKLTEYTTAEYRLLTKSVKLFDTTLLLEFHPQNTDNSTLLKGYCAYLDGLHFSPNTIRLYKKCVQRFISTLSYHDLSPRIIRKILCLMKDDGSTNYTIRNHISALKRFYRYRSDAEGISPEFSKIINMRLPKTNKKLPNFLLEEEMVGIITALDKEVERYRVYKKQINKEVA